MSQLTLIFTIIGLICALTLFGWVCIRLKKKFPSKKWDERQNQAHGTAYQICFWAQIAYVIIVVYLSESFGTPNLTVPLPLLDVLLVGLFIQCILFHLCCLLQGAALPLSERSEQTACWYLIMGIVDLICYLPLSKYDPDGYFGAMKNWYYLLFTITCFYLALLHLIQFIRSRRGERE